MSPRLTFVNGERVCVLQPMASFEREHAPRRVHGSRSGRIRAAEAEETERRSKGDKIQ